MYNIRLTPNAMEQTGAIVEYIASTPQAPETALRWSEAIQKEIHKLREMPHRHRFVNQEPWRSNGLRMLPVKNFLIYFWVNEKEMTVWITAIVYQRRDQLAALLDMPLDLL